MAALPNAADSRPVPSSRPRPPPHDAASAPNAALAHTLCLQGSGGTTGISREQSRVTRRWDGTELCMHSRGAGAPGHRAPPARGWHPPTAEARPRWSPTGPCSPLPSSHGGAAAAGLEAVGAGGDGGAVALVGGAGAAAGGHVHAAGCAGSRVGREGVAERVWKGRCGVCCAQGCTRARPLPREGGARRPCSCKAQRQQQQRCWRRRGGALTPAAVARGEAEGAEEDEVGIWREGGGGRVHTL